MTTPLQAEYERGRASGSLYDRYLREGFADVTGGSSAGTDRGPVARETFGPVAGTMRVPSTQGPEDTGALGTLAEMGRQALVPGQVIGEAGAQFSRAAGRTMFSREGPARAAAAVGRIATQTAEGGALMPPALAGMVRAARTGLDPAYAVTRAGDDFGGASDPRVMATREAARTILTDPMERALGVTPLSNRPDAQAFDIAAQLAVPPLAGKAIGGLSRFVRAVPEMRAAAIARQGIPRAEAMIQALTDAEAANPATIHPAAPRTPVPMNPVQVAPEAMSPAEREVGAAVRGLQDAETVKANGMDVHPEAQTVLQQRYEEAVAALDQPVAGAPRDAAAVQEGLFGDRTLVGKEQTSLLPETAGVPTATLRETKIGADETARLAAERPSTDVPGERPASLFDQPPEVTTTAKAVRRKPLAKRTREELYHHLADDAEFMDKAASQGGRSGLYVGESSHGEMVVGREGGGLGGHMERETIARIEAMAAELRARGETDEQIGRNLEDFRAARDERAGMTIDNEGRHAPGAGYSSRTETPFSSRSLGNERGALGVPEDYGGSHRPPGKGEGSPMHDLTDTYPEDIYGPDGARFYGHGEAFDNESLTAIRAARNRPNAPIRIYRAVPNDLTTADKIAKIESEKAHILRRGKLPPNVETGLTPSQYYDKIATELERLKALPAEAPERVGINPGDWITTSRTYARLHGQSTLRGNYRILSKTVKARDLFSDGNSIHEWGYAPSSGRMGNERGMVGVPHPQTETPEFKGWFGESKVRDESGQPLVVYHGTARPDRVGSVFRRGRATSGPMAFFTDDPEIASKYATGKVDTSLDVPDSYDGWFSYKPKGARSTVDINRAWWHLAPEERARIAELAPRVTTNDAGDIVLADAGHTRGLGGYDQQIKEARGNHLKALVEEWLSSGHLFNSEDEFLDVLKKAGMRGAEFTSPHATSPAVYPVHLAISRPLVTSEIPDEVVAALEQASRRQPMPSASIGADAWDKRVRDPREWIASLKEDRAKGANSFVWSSIPDWVTKTLKRFGYDGIHDTGGKMGGPGHSVWVPFEESQIKSATGNRGTFSRDTKNITGTGALKYLTGLTGAGVGGTAGAAAGSQVGATPEERRRNAILGGLAGAAGGAYLGVKSGQAVEGLNERGAAPMAAEAPPRTLADVKLKGDPLQGPLRKPEENTVRRLDLPEAMGEQVRGIAREFTGPGYESFGQVKRKAASLLKSNDVPIDFTRASRAEVLGAAALLRRNVEETGKLAVRLADPKLTDDARAILDSQMRDLEGQSRTLFNSITSAKTEQARDLAANRIIANLSNTPEHWQYRAQKIADRPLSDTENATIRDLLEKGKRDEALRYIGRLRPTTWMDRLKTVWKAGLLTNLTTHAANTTSNVIFGLTEEAARNPAAFADWAASKLIGAERTKSPTSLAIAKASAEGAMKGLRQVPNRLKGLPTGRGLEEGIIPHESQFGHPILTTFFNAPFRLLDAADAPFFEAALRGSLAEQATVLAKAEGATGAARSARITKLIDAPTDEMVGRAMHDAAVRTYKDPTAVGNLLQKVQTEFPTIGNIVVPFTKTPGAVATRFAEYTPYGFFKSGRLYRQAVKEAIDGIPNPRLTQQAAENFGRASVGLAPIALGAYLYRQGKASGQVDPGAKSERDTKYLLGVPNDAFLVGGQWVEPNRLGPLGMLMSLGAVMAQQAEKNDQTAGGAVGGAAFAGLRTVTDQPFLTGVQSLLQAREGADNATRYLANLSGSVVPSGVGAVERAGDPNLRETRSASDRIQSRIPGQAQKLPLRFDQLGEPAQRFGPGLQNIVSPIRATPDRVTGNPLLEEIRRTGAVITALSPGDNESAADFSQRSQSTGQAVQQAVRLLIVNKDYQAQPMERRKDLIEDTVQRIRRLRSRYPGIGATP